MKIKSTILILFICLWVNQFYGQFTPQKPDLRDCGSAPNYYLDFFNCTSNNYTLDDVFLSISNSSGVPITTPCTPPNIQNVFLWLNYTSNSNSPINQVRIFADILVKDSNGNLMQTLQINSYLGYVTPGSGQNLLNIPGYPSGFPWVCGYQLELSKLLVVWKTNGNINDPEFSSYDCGTYSKSQCELPTSLIVSAPMAVQFDYTQCTTGNSTTVNFDDDTNGGNAPYTYLWNFGDSTTSTLQNPTHTYPYPSGPYTVTLQVTDSGTPPQVSTSTQIVNLIAPINITGSVTSSPCSSGSVGAIDISVAGGTPGYTYLWSNGATSQDVTGLANGTYTVTFTDSVGCTAQKTFVISGGDVIPPIVTAPANLTIEGCNTSILGLNGYFPYSSTISIITQAQFVLAGGTINDASAISSVTYVDTVSGTCPKVVSRLFTITDACNNSTQVTQTITIQDTTPPSITLQADSQTVECNGSGNAVALAAWIASNGGATASDTCSGVTWSNNYSGSLSDLCGATGSATVTFTATDACGNPSSTTATFTIQDTTPPSITLQAASQTVECDGSGNAAALAAWIASNGGATASDTCSGVTWSNNYSGSLSDLCGATGSATVTFTATDACGNPSSTTATFTIQDTTPPSITLQAASQTVECDGSGNAAALAAWIASNGGATGSATVTFTATDACGNPSSTTATFTIQDTTPPSITLQAASQTVECDGSGNAAALAAWIASNGGATASDTCSGVTWSNNYSGSLSDLCGATGSATVTFTATDACGNPSSTTATFTIQDTTPPSITLQAASQTVECDGSGNAAALAAWIASNGGATASDTCSGVTWSNNYSGSLSDLCGATGSATVTFTATDACGNPSSTTATFTIQDTTPPSITLQAASQTVECNGSGNAAELAAWIASNGGATASDTCSGVTWSNNYSGSLSDLCGATGSATVTFTATDACGNPSSTTATFTIQDTTPPSITLQAASQTVECDGSGNAAALAAWIASNGGATASDTCSGVTWSNNYSGSLSDLCGATGSATVTFTATDACGNPTSTTATFTIHDTTDPVIDIQASNLTVECDGQGNTQQLAAWLASNGGASASDNCSVVTWSNNFNQNLSDDCGLTGSVTVTFTAIDACGNDSITSGTFIIQDITDPVIDIQASNLTVECDGQGNTQQLNAWLASNGGASASDTCSGVTWSNNFDNNLSDNCGLTGSVTVIFTATDACGNDSTSSATFTIQDTTDPVIDIQASNLTVECDGQGNTQQLAAWLASNGGASASDTCSGVTWSNNFNQNLSDDCGLTGSVTVTFTATDACGNDSTSSATFTIQDTTDPIIDIQASNLTVECDGQGNTQQLAAWLASNGGASASDTCSGVTWSNNFDQNLSDDCGLTGSVTVTFTATDACGNDSTSSATFTIQDTTDPIIDIQASNLTVECDGQGNTQQLAAWLASNGGASASDTCSGVTWSNNFDQNLSDDCGLTGSVTVTFTATDACGNDSTSSATFTIQDTTDPVIDIQASNLTVECDGQGNTQQLAAWLASNGGASASDTCSGVTWSNNFDQNLSDDCGLTGSVTVIFTATDACGNDSTSSATFTIQDTTDPVIDIQASNLTVECDGQGNTQQLNAWLASNGGASASDTCSGVTWSNNYGHNMSDDCGTTGSVSVTFTATDACGNSSTTSGSFVIQDTTDPVFTSELPQNISVSCDAIPQPQTLTGSDNCSSEITIVSNDEILVDEDGCAGQYTLLRTWTITDSCGNDQSYTQTISVYDNTAPTLVTELITNQNVLCSEIPAVPQLEFIDNCSGVNPNIIYNETSTTISIYQYVIVREWTVSDNCGNEATFTQTLNVSVEDPFDAIPYTICNTETVDLFTIPGLPQNLAQLNGTWVEVNSTGALTGSIFNPANLILGNYYTIRYIVDLEDNDCPLIYEVYIHVDCEVLAACDIVVYNAMSPNGDGLNEIFMIDGITCYPNNNVQIYNRWGVKIYDENGYNNGSVSFKGDSENKLTLGSDKSPGDTYFYVLKYKDSENNSHEKTGYLYIKY